MTGCIHSTRHQGDAICRLTGAKVSPLWNLWIPLRCSGYFQPATHRIYLFGKLNENPGFQADDILCLEHNLTFLLIKTFVVLRKMRKNADLCICIYVCMFHPSPSANSADTTDAVCPNCNKNMTHKAGMKIETERYFNQNNFPSLSQARP
jgi:hypothetical protein